MKAFMLPTEKINEPVRSEFGYYIFEIKNRVIPNESDVKDPTDLTRPQFVRSLFDT
jgi:parvulin-like peptidyl-prolyl isomerase